MPDPVIETPPGTEAAEVGVSGTIEFAEGDVPTAVAINANLQGTQEKPMRSMLAGVMDGGACSAAGLTITIPKSTVWFARQIWQLSAADTTVAVPDDATTYIWACSDGQLRTTASSTPPALFDERTACILCKCTATGGVATIDTGAQELARRADPVDRTVAEGGAGFWDYLNKTLRVIGGLLLPESAAPTIGANMGGVYTKDDGGDTELCFKNGSGEVQITKDGAVNGVLPADSIGDAEIDWGTGAGQVSAVDVPVADSGALFTTDNVEAALAEAMGQANTGVTTANAALAKAGGTLTGLVTLDDLGVLFASHGGAGAPSSGTWADGQLVADSAGDLYLCTTAGTPGTWGKVSTAADLAAYLLLAGGTMAGAIAMGSNKITGVASGAASGEVLHWGQYSMQLVAVAASAGTTINSSSNNAYLPLSGQTFVGTTLANMEIVVEKACTAKNLRGYLSANTLTQDLTLTLMKNGSATAVTVTISSASGAISFADITHSVAFAAGDLITVQITGLGGSANAATLRRIQVELVP